MRWHFAGWQGFSTLHAAAVLAAAGRPEPALSANLEEAFAFDPVVEDDLAVWLAKVGDGSAESSFLSRGRLVWLRLRARSFEQTLAHAELRASIRAGLAAASAKRRQTTSGGKGSGQRKARNKASRKARRKNR